MSFVTQIGMQAVGDAFCLFFGGQRGPWWSTPSNVCPPLSTCSPSTCSSTATPAPQLPLCCGYIRDTVAQMCTGTSGLTDLVKAGSSLGNVVAAQFGATACAEDNCFDPRASSAGMLSASYSLLVAMLIALAAALH
jgi:hypothetical protein